MSMTTTGVAGTLLRLLTITTLLALASACSDPAIETIEDCLNETDDDGDGLTDCADPVCAKWPHCRVPGVELCYNGADDDGDGLTDCADPDCAGTFWCMTDAEDCANGLDDDQDGLIDCADPACADTATCKLGGEDCANGVDDDGDGFTDCDAPACQAVFICLVKLEVCDDNIDNDEDGLTDCADQACANTATCKAGGEDCGNGVDDDGDGLIDCADADCAFTRQCLVLAEDCANGVDDDGDGLTDCDDPQCAGRSVCAGAPRCLPNDQGRVDCSRTECRGVFQCFEICDNGIDDNDDGAIDCVDAICAALPICQLGNSCLNPIDLTDKLMMSEVDYFNLMHSGDPLSGYTNLYDLSMTEGALCGADTPAQAGADVVFKLTLPRPGTLSGYINLNTMTQAETSPLLLITGSPEHCHTMTQASQCITDLDALSSSGALTFGRDETYPKDIYLTFDTRDEVEDEAAYYSMYLNYQGLPPICVKDGTPDPDNDIYSCEDERCMWRQECAVEICDSVDPFARSALDDDFNGQAGCEDVACMGTTLCEEGNSCFNPIDITPLLMPNLDGGWDVPEQSGQSPLMASLSDLVNLGQTFNPNVNSDCLLQGSYTGQDIVYKLDITQPSNVYVSARAIGSYGDLDNVTTAVHITQDLATCHTRTSPSSAGTAMCQALENGNAFEGFHYESTIFIPTTLYIAIDSQHTFVGDQRYQLYASVFPVPM